ARAYRGSDGFGGLLGRPALCIQLTRPAGGPVQAWTANLVAAGVRLYLAGVGGLDRLVIGARRTVAERHIDQVALTAHRTLPCLLRLGLGHRWPLYRRAKVLEEPAYKPDSVPTASAAGGDHLSGSRVTATLVQPTREHRTGRPLPARPCSGWGLPSRPVTRPLVSSYLTVSP